MSHRLNLYLTPSTYSALEKIAIEHGFKSPSEVVQQGVRMVLKAYAEGPDEGFYWKEWGQYQKVKMI